MRCAEALAFRGLVSLLRADHDIFYGCATFIDDIHFDLSELAVLGEIQWRVSNTVLIPQLNPNLLQNIRILSHKLRKPSLSSCSPSKGVQLVVGLKKG